MPTPIRELILEALKDKLSGLPEFNNTTAQRANSEIDVRDLPVITLWDSADGAVDSDVSYSQTTVETPVSIETVFEAANDYQTWSTQANTILANLIVATVGGDRTLGDLADGIRYVGTTIYYPENGSEVIGVDIGIIVRWRHDIGDPFTNSMA